MPVEWVFSGVEEVATLQPAKLDSDWLLLIVSHPNCGFSALATKAISENVQLQQRIYGHAKWIMGQGSVFDIDRYQNWNQMYPNAAVTLVHRNTDWPLESLSATPTFYFSQNCKVAESFSGWPKDGSHHVKVIAALDRIAPASTPTQAQTLSNKINK